MILDAGDSSQVPEFYMTGGAVEARDAMMMRMRKSLKIIYVVRLHPWQQKFVVYASKVCYWNSSQRNLGHVLQTQLFSSPLTATNF